jgi:hypothetical protein
LVEFLSTRGELLDKERPDLPYRRACRAARVHLDSLLARVHQVAAAAAAGVAPPPTRPHLSGLAAPGWGWSDGQPPHFSGSGVGDGGGGGSFRSSLGGSSRSGGGYGGSGQQSSSRSGLGHGRGAPFSSSLQGRQRAGSVDRPKITSPQVIDI